jgi:hypothetical protein
VKTKGRGLRAGIFKNFHCPCRPYQLWGPPGLLSNGHWGLITMWRCDSKQILLGQEDHDSTLGRSRYFQHSVWIRPLLCSSGQSSWLLIQKLGFDSRRYQIFWDFIIQCVCNATPCFYGWFENRQTFFFLVLSANSPSFNTFKYSIVCTRLV